MRTSAHMPSAHSSPKSTGPWVLSSSASQPPFGRALPAFNTQFGALVSAWWAVAASITQSCPVRCHSVRHIAWPRCQVGNAPSEASVGMLNYGVGGASLQAFCVAFLGSLAKNILSGTVSSPDRLAKHFTARLSERAPPRPIACTYKVVPDRPRDSPACTLISPTASRSVRTNSGPAACYCKQAPDRPRNSPGHIP